MKSYYFRTSGWSEDQKKRFEKLLKFDDYLFDKIISWLEKNKELPRFDKKFWVDFERGEKYDVNDIQEAILTTVRTLYNFGNQRNKYEDLISDLTFLFKDMLVFDENISNKIKTLFDLSTKYREIFLTEESEIIGAQRIGNTEGTVALKPVFSKRYDSEEDNIEDYNPEIIKYSPVVMLSLEKVGTEENFSFQMSPKTFNKFLNSLLALQIELKKVLNESRKK